MFSVWAPSHSWLLKLSRLNMCEDAALHLQTKAAWKILPLSPSKRSTYSTMAHRACLTAHSCLRLWDFRRAAVHVLGLFESGCACLGALGLSVPPTARSAGDRQPVSAQGRGHSDADWTELASLWLFLKCCQVGWKIWQITGSPRKEDSNLLLSQSAQKSHWQGNLVKYINILVMKYGSKKWNFLAMQFLGIFLKKLQCNFEIDTYYGFNF